MPNCRLICKRWHFAVNNFLENNAHHRPASGDDLEYKTDQYHYSLPKFANLKRIQFNYPRLREMLTDTSLSPDKNPLIGK